MNRSVVVTVQEGNLKGKDTDTGVNLFGLVKFTFILVSMVVLGLNMPKVTTILFGLLVLLFARPRLQFLSENILLLLFSVTYFMFGLTYGTVFLSDAIKYMIIFQAAYCLGVYTRWDRLPLWPSNTLLAVAAFGTGLLIFSFLSFRLTLAGSGYLISGRKFVSIWDGEIGNGIGLASYAGTVIALMPVAIIGLTRLRRESSSGRRRIFLAMIFCCIIVMGIVGVYINSYMQNRGALLMVVIISIVVMLYYFWKQSIVTNIKAIILGLILCPIFYLILMNFFDINKSFEILTSRFNADELQTNRFHDWIEGLKSLFVNPFGGVKISRRVLGDVYFHNLWLDIGREGGIIPVLFLVIFQLKHVRSVFSILRNAGNILLKIGIISLVIFILFDYQSEPVLDFSANFFCLTLFILGIIRYLGKAMAKNRNMPCWRR